ncbi:MAG: PH domain-containing protein [Lachnospiraceae bacterium]|nr:PH domain-containing protein [Lachnospiraceae bacterium]
MKGYVEKNLRKNETVQAKCHVTWTAFAAIILRALFMGGVGFLILYLASEIIFEFRAPDDDLMYFASDEAGIITDVLTALLIVLISICIIYAAVSIIKLICIELVVTDKKLIGKTGVIYSNAIDVYLEKIDNFAIDESLMGRIFKYSIITVGTASTTLRFPYMQNAVEFKNKVMDCYDARKTALMAEQAELIHSTQEKHGA